MAQFATCGLSLSASYPGLEVWFFLLKIISCLFLRRRKLFSSLACISHGPVTQALQFYCRENFEMKSVIEFSFQNWIDYRWVWVGFHSVPCTELCGKFQGNGRNLEHLCRPFQSAPWLPRFSSGAKTDFLQVQDKGWDCVVETILFHAEFFDH